MFLSRKDDELNNLEYHIKQLEMYTGILFCGNIDEEEDVKSYYEQIREYRNEMIDLYDNK